MIISKIQLQDVFQSKLLLEVQQAAYQVEAALIGSTAIPALKEDLETLQNCGETFYGYWIEDSLAGAISYKREGEVLDIYRLVVHPYYFRRGIGKALVRFIEEAEDHIKKIIVSTGTKNLPAKKLYEVLGFRETGEREVMPGLWITLFEKWR
ncbi:GNAT family N-acetyltransferase [Tengunoibacter tsumagoiensis]|uniref:N-acetyltransferase n=1 Tax=Tengunoibacter tsumagoiensis TaxID=2014871 RepID=A0A401ZWD0_9CHLR|nr:GNAT family N-acetyltransferase [Tengunoibacter tsumagoiensis]GCE11080.1 N-acetyltransferase [Tengunoibacter tsumagoiensis]